MTAHSGTEVTMTIMGKQIISNHWEQNIQQ